MLNSVQHHRLQGPNLENLEPLDVSPQDHRGSSSNTHRNRRGFDESSDSNGLQFIPPRPRPLPMAAANTHIIAKTRLRELLRLYFCFVRQSSPPPSWRATSLEYEDTIQSAMRLINDHNYLSSSHPQRTIDLFASALDAPPECLGSERQTIVRCLQEMTSTLGLLPRRLKLPSVTNRSSFVEGGEVIMWVARLNGRQVASREFRPPDSGSWEDEEGIETLKSIRREVIIRLSIHHRNIVPLIGTTTDRHHPLALISPYYTRGHSVNYPKKLKHTETPAAILRIGADIASALHYLHTLSPPIMHGDVHPRNIVIDDHGNALLIDFGLARIKYEHTRSRTDVATGGSYRYLAPELVVAMIDGSNFRTSAPSDCYALGMTILSLLTGKHPFTECSNSLHAMYRAKEGSRPARPSHRLGGLSLSASDQIWELLERMWAHDPKIRPSLDVVRMDLLRILPSTQRPQFKSGLP